MPGFENFFEKSIFKTKSNTDNTGNLWSEVSNDVYHRRQGVYNSSSGITTPFKVSTFDRIVTFLGMPFLTEDRLNVLSSVTIPEDDDEAFHDTRKVKHESPGIRRVKKLARWNDQDFRLFNILRALVIVPLNIALIIPRLLLNVLKLVTEYLPRLLSRWSEISISKAIRRFKQARRHSDAFIVIFRIFIVASLIILIPLCIAFKLTYILGRAITSPTDSLYAAWEAGEELAGKGFLGKAVSLFFATISLAITITAYTILFPLAIKFIATYAPSAIVSVVQTVINFLGNHVPPFFINLANLIAPVFNPLLQAVGVVSAWELLLVGGMSIMIGTSVGAISVGMGLLEKFEKLMLDFSDWYERRTPRQTAPSKGAVFVADEDTQQKAPNIAIQILYFIVDRIHRWKEGNLQYDVIIDKDEDNKKNAEVKDNDEDDLTYDYRNTDEIPKNTATQEDQSKVKPGIWTAAKLHQAQPSTNPDQQKPEDKKKPSSTPPTLGGTNSKDS